MPVTEDRTKTHYKYNNSDLQAIISAFNHGPNLIGDERKDAKAAIRHITRLGAGQNGNDQDLLYKALELYIEHELAYKIFEGKDYKELRGVIKDARERHFGARPDLQTKCNALTIKASLKPLSTGLEAATKNPENTLINKFCSQVVANFTNLFNLLELSPNAELHAEATSLLKKSIEFVKQYRNHPELISKLDQLQTSANTKSERATYSSQETIKEIDTLVAIYKWDEAAILADGAQGVAQRHFEKRLEEHDFPIRPKDGHSFDAFSRA